MSFAFIVVRSCFQKRADINEIRANPQFTIGKIIKYETTGQGAARRSVEYEYTIKGVLYKSAIVPRYRLSCEGSSSRLSNCIGKKYKVIYSKKHPEKSYLLCERYSYELFNLRVPYWLDD